MARTSREKNHRPFRAVLILFLCVCLLLGASVLGVNAYVKHVGGARLMSPEQVQTLEAVDCIVVLGCQVHPDGTPSDMLRDRLDQAIALYHAGVAPKLLMSGDHGQVEYNEVGAMKAYAMEHGVPSDDVFMDHAGFSTYETMVRAKEVFCAKRVVVVTQQYHLYRALYVANAIELEAHGVAADAHVYVGQGYRECREIAARVKDAAMAVFQPDPTFLGEPIPVSGDGNVTGDAV